MKIYILFAFLFPIGIYAQSLDNWVVGSGGEVSVNSGMQLSWTLGEPNIATISKNGRKFTEGFHQSYLEVKEVILKQPELQAMQIQIYPNPASDQVQVNFGDNLPRDFDLRLMDSNGKLLQFQQFQSANEVSIDLEGLPASIYLISIQIKEQLSSLPHSFQIIKH